MGGSYRDVVMMEPVKNISVEKMNNFVMHVLKQLKDVGFFVVAISCDNHVVNRHFFKKRLCGGEIKTKITNPFDSTKPIYLLFDSTHNFKNIYNNFQKKRVFEVPFEDELVVAKYEHLEELYDHENKKPVKIAHKLNKTVLNPNNLQKTSVKLAASVFHESTIEALNFYSDSINPEWKNTSRFLNKIKYMWEMINVRTPRKGVEKRNKNMEPIKSEFDEKIDELKVIASWFSEWQNKSRSGLTNETFLANIQTLKALSELSYFLIKEIGYHYVLLGKVQSDNLEERFGWYRQKCGGNYYISFKDVLITERKIRALSLIKFSNFDISAVDNFVEEATETESNFEEINNTLNNINLQFWPDHNDQCIIYYVAGYIAQSVGKRTKCACCQEYLSEDQLLAEDETIGRLLNCVNRGGLRKPSEIVFKICCFCWAIFYEIRQRDDMWKLFFKKPFRSIFLSLISAKMMEANEFIISHCENGHEFFCKIVVSFLNCAFKNLTQELKCFDGNQRKMIKLTSNS